MTKSCSLPRLTAELRERLRLVVAAERAQRAAELRRVGGEQGAIAPSLVPVALSAQVADRRRVVSGERGDLAELEVSLPEPVELARVIGCRTSERPGLFEAAEHGEQPGSVEQRHGIRIRREDGIERLERLVGRSRSKDERGGKTGQPRVVPACEPQVAECLLRRVRPLLEPGAEVRDAVAERVPDPCESGVVFCVF